MAEQAPTPPADVKPDAAPATLMAQQPTDAELLTTLVGKLRQANVTDNQVSRHVQFTEDEMKAMADMLQGIAERMGHGQAQGAKK